MLQRRGISTDRVSIRMQGTVKQNQCCAKDEMRSFLPIIILKKVWLEGS